MSTNKGKGPIVDSGECRCCGGRKKCRLLNVQYEWCGQPELYTDMFVDCFGLMLSHLDGEVEKRLICATCVSRLREACAFRKQVLQCEERLLHTAIHVHDSSNPVKEEGLKVEVEETAAIEDHIEDGGDHIDNDTASSIDEPLIKPAKKLSKIRKVLTKGRTKGKNKDKSVARERLEKKRNSKMRVLTLRRRNIDVENIDQLYDADLPPAPVTRPKVLDSDHKAFLNTVTIVENSYVCPFDTSFSDYYCLYCRELFTDPSKLREHTLNHDPTTFKQHVNNKKIPKIDIFRIDCRLCPKRIDDIDVFKGHLSNFHGKLLHDDVSNEFLKFRLTLTTLTCTECDSSFSFFHALKKHMAEHFGTCICDVCGAHYFEERMLILHQKTHQRVDENYPCKECGKTFKSKHSRYLHEARTHKKEPAYQCSKCDEVLFSYSLRYRHMIEVHGERRLFPCEHCDRAYDSRKSLREHVRRFHLKIFKHQCDLCDKRFYLPSRLKEHMATHTGERNFRCEYCGKSYPRLRGLKVHMQSHSSEKKYSCVLCNATFTQNVNLKNHMKRQHQTLEMEDGYPE